MIDSAKKLLTEASAHRARARAALRGNWACAVIAAFLVGILSGEGSALHMGVRPGRIPPVSVSVPTALRDLLDYAIDMPKETVFAISAVMLVLGLLLTGVMELGFARYSLDLIDGRKARLRDLFAGIPRFSDGLVMHLLRTGLVFLGDWLFLVPGIVLRYGLAMAPYILTEDPACSGTEALQRSWNMMRGHKLELLTLEVTFLGWVLMSAYIFSLADFPLNAYRAAAKADFYRKIAAQA